MGGTYIIPRREDFLSLSGGTLTGATRVVGNFSADTIFSGSTDLSSLLTAINDITRVQEGINTFTGGTGNLPTVNVTGLTIDNIDVSGSSVFNTLTAVTLSGGTIFSGSTDLSNIFQTIHDIGHTDVQDGTNIFTAGTANNPSVNITGLTIDSITVSGDASYQGLSAVTYYSGSTDVSDLFIHVGQAGDITRVQEGINTFTAGTANNPTVNITGLTIDNITVSGESSFQGLSAITIFSGSTDLSDIFVESVVGGTNINVNGNQNVTVNLDNDISLNSVSATGLNLRSMSKLLAQDYKVLKMLILNFQEFVPISSKSRYERLRKYGRIKI